MQETTTIHDEQSDRGQHSGEPDTEGCHKEHAERNALERNRSQQHDKRRRTREQSTRNPQRQQATHRDWRAVRPGHRMGMWAAPAVGMGRTED